MTEARSFRIYGTPDQLTLALVTVNETARPMALNQAMFSSHVRFSVLRTMQCRLPSLAAGAWWVGGRWDWTSCRMKRLKSAQTEGIEWRIDFGPRTGSFHGRSVSCEHQLSDEMAARSTTRRMQLAVLAGQHGRR
jgi:hypothetical protein